MSKKPPTKKPASKKRTRQTKIFPACSFEESLSLANAIQKHASGQKVRRLTLFNQMGKSPSSGPSRKLITNSGKYNLTKGGYTAEYLELTKDGRLATDSEANPGDQQSCYENR